MDVALGTCIFHSAIKPLQERFGTAIIPFSIAFISISNFRICSLVGPNCYKTYSEHARTGKVQVY